MRVVFMGTPEFSVPALDAVAAAHDVVCVYSQPPRPAGRGQKLRPSPVHQRADALGIPVRHPERLKGHGDDFAALEPDVAVVVAYGLLLPRAILDAPRFGCLNIHASLLPRWRGAAPIHRAVMAGDEATGVCIMQMEAGLDTGPVLMRETTPIGPTDTTGDLHDRLADMGGRLIAQALAGLPMAADPQPEAGVTYAHKIDKAEARVDWTRPAAEVARHINGLSPFPGAWCEAGGARLKLMRAEVITGAGTTGAPGQVLGGLDIACGQGTIRVLAAQRPGKAVQTAEVLLRGWSAGERVD